MGGIIFIVIILVVFVSTISKHAGQKKETSKDQGKSSTSQKAYVQRTSYVKKTQKPQDDILTRAKRNVAEYEDDRLEDLESEAYHEKSTGFHVPHKAYRPVEDTSEPEAKDTILYQDMEDGEDLMSAVYDVMVKGVDCSVPFERDFIAEGQEMLNRVYS